MTRLLVAAILLCASVAAAQDNRLREKGEPFRLEAGDYRWEKLVIRQTPAEVDCHFEVLTGDPTVHVELLPLSEFRLFDRGADHDSLVATADGRQGDFRRIIDMSGQYAVVVVNGKRAPPATVSLEVRTNVNPEAKDIAQTLSPERRLTVIAISFAFFFVTVAWSARKLIRATRPS